MGLKRRAGFHAEGAIEEDLRQQMRDITNEKSKPWIMNPYSKFRFHWDILTIVFIFVTIVMIPLEFSIYDDRSEMDILKAVTDCWFTVDIMLNFCTGVVVNSGRNHAKDLQFFLFFGKILFTELTIRKIIHFSVKMYFFLIFFV